MISIHVYPYLSLSLVDLPGVSHFIEFGKASSNPVQRRVDTDDLWIIMERVAGFSLKEFIERKGQHGLPVPEAIKLTLKLTGILQQIHNKDILHQNLSPENIMIEWDRQLSIDDAQLTVLNFSQSVDISNKPDQPAASSAQKWYHAAQMSDEGLRSTIDSSGSCAVLFWLLTQIEPQHDDGKLPHQLHHDQLNGLINTTAKLSST
jgi:serine/threonine protein kinase